MSVLALCLRLVRFKGNRMRKGTEEEKGLREKGVGGEKGIQDGEGGVWRKGKEGGEEKKDVYVSSDFSHYM